MTSQLNIPPGQLCMIPDCTALATHLPNLRMRRKDTGADWGPNIPFYLCTAHATNGLDVSLGLRPNDSGNVRIRVFVAAAAATRTVPIKKRGGEQLRGLA